MTHGKQDIFDQLYVEWTNELVFSFVLPTIDQRYQVESMSLLNVSPETMEINVQDDRVLSLIRHWSVDRVFSAGQITIFNHKLNQLLAHARTLGFTVNQTLLDNTKPLRLNLQSEFELTNEVLDDIFIVAMKIHPTIWKRSTKLLIKYD